jgi:Domain of unknown function (DUF4258)
VSETLAQVRVLVAKEQWQPTTHALIRLAERDILIADVLRELELAVVVEDYPSDPRGASVLLLSYDSANLPIHAHWGIPANNRNIVNLVTVYRPDASEWHPDWKTRR